LYKKVNESLKLKDPEIDFSNVYQVVKVMPFDSYIVFTEPKKGQVGNLRETKLSPIGEQVATVISVDKDLSGNFYVESIDNVEKLINYLGSDYKISIAGPSTNDFKIYKIKDCPNCLKSNPLSCDISEDYKKHQTFDRYISRLQNIAARMMWKSSINDVSIITNDKTLSTLLNINMKEEDINITDKYFKGLKSNIEKDTKNSKDTENKYKVYYKIDKR
jgi:hypothetical protein